MAHTAEIVQAHARGTADTGSPDVEVALLTARIYELTPHFKTHAKDHHGRRGLLKMVNARKRLLAYLKGKDADRYTALIAKLGRRKYEPNGKGHHKVTRSFTHVGGSAVSFQRRHRMASLEWHHAASALPGDKQ